MESLIIFELIGGILIILLLIIAWPQRQIRAVPRAHQITNVKLNPCYSLNKLKHLNINGLLPENENVCYETFIYDILFSAAGDVYLKREFMKRYTCWEHFSPTGESLGLVKKGKTTKLVRTDQLGYAQNYFFELDEQNRLILIVEL